MSRLDCVTDELDCVQQVLGASGAPELFCQRGSLGTQLCPGLVTPRRVWNLPESTTFRCQVGGL